MIAEPIIDMYPEQTITVQNSVQIPFYNLLLNIANGFRTTFLHVDTFSCVMAGNQVKIDLNAYKVNNFIQFTYKDKDKDK